MGGDYIQLIKAEKMLGEVQALWIKSTKGKDMRS
jgi:hypothetical protein